MNLTAVLIEDQPLARARLRDLLARVDGVEIVAEATSATEGRRAIQENEPDLVLLDIEMPGGSGLDLLRDGGPRPYVVLTTAHANFAVEAFELAADDYLLKPFGQKRLATAVTRARRQIARNRRLDRLDHPAPTATADRIFIPERGRIVPVTLSAAHHLEAEGDYVKVWIGTRAHLLRQTMAAIEARVGTDRFLRVHRSHLVNVDCIRAVRRYDNARFLFELTNGREVLSARGRNATIRRHLGL